MDSFPETELTENQAKVIARAMLAVARCGGELDEREMALIKDFFPGDIESLPPIEPVEIGAALSGTAQSTLLLQSCLLVAFADRSYSAEERGLVTRYAQALNVAPEEVDALAQSVKEYLLRPLSRLANVEGVAGISQKLGR